MALIENWYPPTKENYDFILFIWFFFPLNYIFQHYVPWYGMGKTSVNSILNIPGRIAWFTMEIPGFLSLLYMMNTLPAKHGITDLPWQNKVIGALFVIHYLYRAVIFPFIQPSMSPIHLLVWNTAVMFQLANGTLIGSWLAAYGPVTKEAWATQLAPFPTLQFAVGIAVFYLGLAANFYHDEELRDIRRREQQRQARLAKEQAIKPASIGKHYQIPQAGLFKYVLYPHYLVEWVEWLGFYIACGFSCLPALMFLVNEISAMLPRAVNGRKWYVEKFGEEKLRDKRAIIPGLL